MKSTIYKVSSEEIEIIADVITKYSLTYAGQYLTPTEERSKVSLQCFETNFSYFPNSFVARMLITHDFHLTEIQYLTLLYLLELYQYA